MKTRHFTLLNVLWQAFRFIISAMGMENDAGEGRKKAKRTQKTIIRLTPFEIVPRHSQWSFIAFQQMVYFLPLLFTSANKRRSHLPSNFHKKSKLFSLGFAMNLSLISFSIEERITQKKSSAEGPEAKKYIKLLR